MQARSLITPNSSSLSSKGSSTSFQDLEQQHPSRRSNKRRWEPKRNGDLILRWDRRKNYPQTKGGVLDLKSTFERCEGLVWVQNNVSDWRFPSQVMSLAPAN